MQRKLISIFVFILGIAFLLGGMYFLLTPNATEESGSLLKVIGGIFLALLGSGASFKSWKDLLKKDSPPPPTTQITSSGNNAQISTGKDGKNIQTNTYIEQVKNYHESPPPPPSAKGFVPASRSVYIHRGEIEDEVRNALRVNGVAAIVGLHAPGGLGKTELAIRAANDLQEEQGFEKTLWVDMGEKKPSEIITSMLRICGIQIQPGDSYEIQRQLLQGFLQNQSLLVVLDDVRKVNAANLPDFLPPSPPCAALVTSRMNSFSAIPATNTFSLDKMNKNEAEELFRKHLSTELLTKEISQVAALFERCQFNPLALEISARRIAGLVNFKNPVALFLKKIEKSLSELRVADDENLNLFAVFDASYRELDEADQTRFAALAAFHPSGFSPAAAAFLWEVEDTEATHILERFLRQTLLKTVPGELERYRLHDLLDEYAAYKLKERNEKKKASAQQAKWLIALFSDHFTDDSSTAPHVAHEMDNLRQAIAWAEKEKDGDLLANLLDRARNWFVVLNLYAEWGDWVKNALGFGISDKRLEANTRQAIGDVQRFRDQYDAALDSYNAALKLFQKVGSQLGEANTRAALARLTLQKGDLAGAIAAMEKVIPTRRAIGDIYSEGADYGNFSIVLLNRGHKKEAKAYALLARTAFEQVGEPHLVDQINQIITACEE